MSKDKNFFLLRPDAKRIVELAGDLNRRAEASVSIELRVY